MGTRGTCGGPKPRARPIWDSGHAIEHVHGTICSAGSVAGDKFDWSCLQELSELWGTAARQRSQCGYCDCSRARCSLYITIVERNWATSADMKMT
jgi:hypothetical protein